MNVAVFNRITNLPQTLFGLPMLVTGALLGWNTSGFSWVMLLIVPAFLCARIAGMTFNQLIDRKIDAKNPRTENRVLPTKQAFPGQVIFLAWTSSLLLILLCFLINKPCFWLSFLVVFLVASYSYTKRFTPFSHFVLGSIHFLCPVMAALAACPHLSLPAILLGIACFCLISGNDIVYAIQDIDFDRGYMLHSIPAKYGVFKSLQITYGLHLGCVLSLAFVGVFLESLFVAIALPLTSTLLFLIFHLKCYRAIKNKTSLMPCFFWSNACVAIAAMIFVLIQTL